MYSIENRDAVAACQQRLQALTEPSWDAVLVASAEGVIRYLDSSCTRVFGCATADLLGHSLRDQVHPEDRAACLRQLSDVASVPGSSADAQYRFLHAGGAVRWLECTASNLLHDPSVRGIVCNIRDITDRKRAEQFREDQRHILEQIARSASLPEVLEAIVRSTEEQGEGLLASVLLYEGDVLVPGAAPSLPAEYVRSLGPAVPLGPATGSCGTAAFLKKRVVVEDISRDPLWENFRHLALPFGLLACWSTPVLSASGELLGTFALYYREPRGPTADELAVVEVATHLTEIALARSRSELALQERESRYRQIVETGVEGIWMLDQELRTSYVNPQMAALLQHSPEALLGRTLFEFVPPSHLDEVQRCLAQQPEGGYHRFELPYLRSDGTLIWLSGRATLMYGEDGEFLGALGMFTDSTERRQAEQDRAELLAREQAARADAERLAATLAEQREALAHANRELQNSNAELWESREMLRLSEQRFRTVFETVGVGMKLLDLEGRIVESNPTAYQILASSPAALLGRHFQELTHPADVQDDQTQFKELVSGRREKYTLEKRLRRGDGTVLWGHVVTSLVRDAEGRPQHVVRILEDVTARKAADERSGAFQVLGMRLNAARTPEEAARITLAVADELLGWDACWVELWEPDADSSHTVLMMDLLDSVRCEVTPLESSADGLQRAREIVGEGPRLFLQDPSPLRPCEYGFGDTSRPSASLMFVPVRSGGRDVGVLSIQSYTPYAYDAASLETLQALADYCAGALQRTRAEAARQRLEEELHQTQKMEALGTLAGGVAHDFNNMLSVINGYAELLLSGKAPEQTVTTAIEQISRAGERAADLTRQLLAFSRRQVLQPRVVPLTDVIESTTKMLSRLIGEDIEVVTLPDPDTGQVRADPGQLERVLMNLAVNARDAMPLGGKLLIRTENVEVSVAQAQQCRGLRSGRYVLLTVTDMGCGMDAETLTRIFEPFFTTKEPGKGTGLGLATVHGVVNQSGGHVEAESAPGQGTTFRIYLPRVDEPPAEGRVKRPPSRDGGSETILLVEDEPMVRRVARVILEANGYRVLEAMCGRDALTLLADHPKPIQLLLTDLVMPHMSGSELARQVVALRPEIRVLFMSGHIGDAALRHGLEADGQFFLQKPFTSAALTAYVRAALGPPAGCSDCPPA